VLGSAGLRAPRAAAPNWSASPPPRVASSALLASLRQPLGLRVPLLPLLLLRRVRQ